MGVTRAFLSQPSGSTPRTGHSTGGHDARIRPGADCKSARGNRTHSTSRHASGRRPLESRIFAFKTMRRRLSNAVAELGTRCPCKSLMQRLCCRETLEQTGFDTGRGRNRKSITAAKIRKDAIFARSFKYVARMEPTGPARSGRPDDRLRVIRDCREASMPPRITLRSIRATLAKSPVS